MKRLSSKDFRTLWDILLGDLHKVKVEHKPKKDYREI